MTTEEKWDALLDMGVYEQTLRIVTDINGMNDETMDDVLYAFTGERTFEGEDE